MMTMMKTRSGRLFLAAWSLVVLGALGLPLPSHASAPTRKAVAHAIDPAFRRSPPMPWIAVAAAAVLDIATTESALHRGCHELNPIYGRHPNLGTLTAVHALPLALLWPVRRNRWLYAPALLLGGIAVHNAMQRCGS